MVIESFAWYSSLGWHLCFCRSCKVSSQTLVDFRVSIEKSVVIEIVITLYVIWPFSCAAFSILFGYGDFIICVLCGLSIFFSGRV